MNLSPPDPVAAIVTEFEHLTPQSLDRLMNLYAPQARFVDPFNDVIGPAAIRQVFAHMFATLQAPRFDAAGEFQALGMGARGQQLHHVLDDLVEVEVQRLGLELAGLDLREVQDVVDDGQQGVARAFDHFEALALLGAKPRFDETMRRIERDLDLEESRIGG